MSDTGMKVWRDAKRVHDIVSGSPPYTTATTPDQAAAAVITAAMAQDKARIAELEEALKEAIRAVDTVDLDAQLCCGGQMCGCHGSTNRDLLLHDLRTTLEARNVTDA